MLKNREKNINLQYEEPSVQIVLLNVLDVLRTSPDTGEEYPDEWN